MPLTENSPQNPNQRNARPQLPPTLTSHHIATAGGVVGSQVTRTRLLAEAKRHATEARRLRTEARRHANAAAQIAAEAARLSDIRDAS